MTESGHSGVVSRQTGYDASKVSSGAGLNQSGISASQGLQGVQGVQGAQGSQSSASYRPQTQAGNGAQYGTTNLTGELQEPQEISLEVDQGQVQHIALKLNQILVMAN